MPGGRLARPTAPPGSFFPSRPRHRVTMIDLFGIEPTGEGFTVDGIDIFTIEAGEITEVYTHWDILKMVHELGVVSAAGSTIG